jgi:hypothetical protein
MASDFVSKAIVGILTERLRKFPSSCVKLTNFAVLGVKFAKFSIQLSWGKKTPWQFYLLRMVVS